MPKTILWLDNDSAYIKVYAKYLEEQPEPFTVTIASTITDAQTLLASRVFDLLILDVMVPTTTEQEEQAFPPDLTDHGLKTGLTFYATQKDTLDQAGTKVLVLTARIDEGIKQGFEAVGLGSDQLVEKPEVGDVDDFLSIVQRVLGN